MLCIINGQATQPPRLDCSCSIVIPETFPLACQLLPGFLAHLSRANIESKRRHPSTKASWQAVVSVRHFNPRQRCLDAA